MRKRCTAILTGILYAVLVVSLLVLQTKTIQGDITRLAANGLTVLLLIPTLFLFRVWLNAQRTEGKMPAEEGMPAEKNTAERSAETAAEQQLSLVVQEELFYEQMEQAGLSAREQEVAWLIYRGYANRQIAEELYISETTVKKHASHIYEKLQISGRKELRSCISKAHFL